MKTIRYHVHMRYGTVRPCTTLTEARALARAERSDGWDAQIERITPPTPPTPHYYWPSTPRLPSRPACVDEIARYASTCSNAYCGRLHY
jgi:hypothetical protein